MIGLESKLTLLSVTIEIYSTKKKKKGQSQIECCQPPATFPIGQAQVHWTIESSSPISFNFGFSSSLLSQN
jgi:hypothetical protein